MGLIMAGLPIVSGCTGVIACSQTASTPSGITIERGHVIATMHLSCSSPPDSFDFRIILVRDQHMLTPGRAYSTIPTATGYDATTFAPCAPGTWHVYYLATWSADGQTEHNDTTTLADTQVVLDDC